MSVPVFIQANGVGALDNQMDIPVALNSSATAGSFFLVYVITQGAAPTSITDTLGNVYTLRPDSIFIWTAPNTHGAGANTVTAHWPDTTTTFQIVVVSEFSGQFAASPIEQIVQGDDQTNMHSVGATATTIRANDLVIGVGYYLTDDVNCTADSGQTLQFNGPANTPLCTAVILTQPAVSPGAYTPSCTLDQNVESAFTTVVLASMDAPTQATPTFSPVAGTYSTAQSVTITSAGADAIYYTLDGSTPTTSSTLYTGAITIATSKHLQAIAVKVGYHNSAVGSAVYLITGGGSGGGGQTSVMSTHFPTRIIG